MQLSALNLALTRAGKLSPIANMLAELRKFGSDAHLYLPGVGVISGVTAGNYLDSAGTTVASVDGLVGLVLDAAGSVGAELVTGQTWTTGSANTSISGGNVTVFSGAASGAVGSAAFAVVLGKTYRTTFTVSGLTAGQIGVDVGGASTYTNINSNGTFTQNTVCAGGAAIYAVSKAAGTSASVQIISVHEVTGIHATQATTGNKPTLRRGLVNLLTWSNDLTNVAWAKVGTASSASATALNLPAVNDYVYHWNPAAAGSGHTIAAMLSGSGTVTIKAGNGTDGYEVSQVTLTSTPTLFAVSKTVTVSECYLQIARGGTDTATSVTCDGAGLFQGTLTADQILAAGGIPLTTTAPASSSIGAYAFEFDGSNDYLALGGVPFQQSDDHAVVVAFRCNSASGWKGVFEQRNTGVTGPKAPALEFAAGNVYAYYQDDAGLAIAPNVPMGIGEAGVVSVRKKSNTRSIRKNAGAWSSDSTILGTTTINSSLVGASGFGPTNFFNGSMWPIVVIKGTVSDAQLLIFERMINALSGYAAGNF